MKRKFYIILLVLSVFFSSMPFLNPVYAAERGEGVTGEVIPEQLKGMEIKKSFVSSSSREVGVIQTLTGTAIVAHGDLTEAYFALPGDSIYEKDRVFTLGDARCRLKFIDENVITMGSDAEISAEEVVADLGLGEKKSLFSLTKGKAMFYALKMFRYRKATMDVQTATAVVGVRGTKFGIEVRKGVGENLASRPIYIADASDKGWFHLAQATPDNTATTVLSFDGQVNVTSTADQRTQTVAPGQMLTITSGGLGEVTATPPQVGRQFESDTEAPPPQEETTGEEVGAGGEGGGETPEGNGEDETNDSPALADAAAPQGADTTTTDTTDITQQQTAQTVETENEPVDDEPAQDPLQDPGTNASGESVGYLSAMLTNSSAGSLEEIFVSTKRQDFDSDFWMRGSKDPAADYLRANDASAGTDSVGAPYAKWGVFASGTKNTGDLESNYPITHTELGNYSYIDSYNGTDTYLEWGHWTMENSFNVDGSQYTINNKGYYLVGYSTPQEELAGLTGTAMYSGGADGTYWTSSGGVDMSGSFSCYVDFGTDEISEFNMSLTDQGNTHSASITQSYQDKTPFNADGTFSVTNGQWSLNGATPDHKMAHGSFYGRNFVGGTAQAIGGAWGMYKTNGEGATGIFHGQQVAY